MSFSRFSAISAPSLFPASFLACGLAYIVSMMIYQFGSLFTGNVHPVGLIVAISELVFIIYMLVRKNPYVDEATGMAKKSIA